MYLEHQKLKKVGWKTWLDITMYNERLTEGSKVVDESKLIGQLGDTLSQKYDRYIIGPIYRNTAYSSC